MFPETEPKHTGSKAPTVMYTEAYDEGTQRRRHAERNEHDSEEENDGRPGVQCAQQ